MEVRPKRPNALFESWLEHWLEDAIKRDSRSHSKIRIALDSLRAYPLPLSSGKECAVIRGFNQTLCDRIDRELENRQLEVANLLKDSKKINQQINKVAETVKSKKKKSVKTQQHKQKIQTIQNVNTRVTLHPGTFKIILIIDTQETNGKNGKCLDETRSQLMKMNVEYEVRRLVLGDFLWIARESMSGEELILPYIVERKRIDDLAGSIRDGRFHEQKHRLKYCNIDNIIYLIESYPDDNVGIPIDSLKQALCNTMMHNRFVVVQVTDNLKTVAFLRDLTHFMNEQFSDKILQSIDHEESDDDEIDGTETIKLLKYQTLSTESSQNHDLSVREIFIQQLLQLHSLTLEKALAITDIYPSPKSLLEAYNGCETITKARNLLANFRYGPLERQIGEKTSSIVYDYYKSNY